MAVEANRQNDAAEIKRVLGGGVEAIRDKNIEGVMSIYAQDVVCRNARFLHSLSEAHWLVGL